MEKRPDSMERITSAAQAEAFIAQQITAIRAQVGDKRVLLALSGGVDSSVVAALLIKAIGKPLVRVHVNHGLLRKGEPEQVCEVFGKQLGAELVGIGIAVEKGFQGGGDRFRAMPGVNYQALAVIEHADENGITFR